MKQYKITNRTQGRLELKSLRRVLDAGESFIVSGPLAEDVKNKMGSGPYRNIDVVELADLVLPTRPIKTKPLQSVEPDSVSPTPVADYKRRGKSE